MASWTAEARRFLAGRGYDPTFGARPLKRLIQKDVADELARLLLAGKLADGGEAQVDVSADRESIEIHTGAESKKERTRTA